MKKVLKECVTCMKAQGKPFKSPPVAALPDFRVKQSTAFANVGIDFAGPLFVKSKTAEMVESYLALFTCCYTSRPFEFGCRTYSNYIFTLLTKVCHKEGHSILDYIRKCQNLQGICESDKAVLRQPRGKGALRKQSNRLAIHLGAGSLVGWIL